SIPRPLPPTPSSQLYTLSLHDALPIYSTRRRHRRGEAARPSRRPPGEPSRHRLLRRADSGGADSVEGAPRPALARPARPLRDLRSEEHTSELQSRFDLVCRLLLEKKKN